MKKEKVERSHRLFCREEMKFDQGIVTALKSLEKQQRTCAAREEGKTWCCSCGGMEKLWATVNWSYGLVYFIVEDLNLIYFIQHGLYIRLAGRRYLNVRKNPYKVPDPTGTAPGPCCLCYRINAQTKKEDTVWRCQLVIYDTLVPEIHMPTTVEK